MTSGEATDCFTQLSVFRAPEGGAPDTREDHAWY